MHYKLSDAQYLMYPATSKRQLGFIIHKAQGFYNWKASEFESFTISQGTRVLQLISLWVSAGQK